MKSVQIDTLKGLGVRTLLSGSMIQPAGLVPIDGWEHGNAPIINDIGKLVDFNNEIVVLCKRLSALLDEAHSLPVFSSGSESEKVTSPLSRVS